MLGHGETGVDRRRQETGDRSGPTNLKRSRGERVSWGGEAEVKSTGTVRLLRRRHKVNTSAQPSGLRGTHGTAEPTLSLSLSLSLGAARSSLGSAGNGCFTHTNGEKSVVTAWPLHEAFKDPVRLCGIVSPKHSRGKDRRESFYPRTSAERLSAPERQTKQRCHRPSGAAQKTSLSSCLSGAPARRSRRRSRIIGGEN